MRFILHYTINKKSSSNYYNLGKIMLYFLGKRIHLSGISEFNYFMSDTHKKEEIYFKLAVLIKGAQGEVKEQYEGILQEFKKFNKVKNKNSSAIVKFNLVKREIEQHFLNFIEEQYTSLDKIYGIKLFKHLIDYDKVNFYHLNPQESIKINAKVTPLLNILSLQLDNELDEYPILFLSNDSIEGEPLIELETYSFTSDEALKLSNGYLEDAFQFPGLVGIPSTLMKSITKEFIQKATDAIDQLQEWTKICYENPNTTKGVTYFKQNVVPVLEQKRRTVYETYTIKEISKTTSLNYSFHLQFGELPINKIWEIIHANGNCTLEELESLLKIKEEQSPKYNGRWPVVFFKTDDTEVYIKEVKKVEDLKPRKTLNID